VKERSVFFCTRSTDQDHPSNCCNFDIPKQNYRHHLPRLCDVESNGLLPDVLWRHSKNNTAAEFFINCQGAKIKAASHQSIINPGPYRKVFYAIILGTIDITRLRHANICIGPIQCFFYGDDDRVWHKTSSLNSSILQHWRLILFKIPIEEKRHFPPLLIICDISNISGICASVVFWCTASCPTRLVTIAGALSSAGGNSAMDRVVYSRHVQPSPRRP